MRVGVDTGGTFTDVVTDDGRVAKVPSTPRDPGDAVRSGVDLVADAHRPEALAHGTTVATNAVLERKGATVALVTNAGFADVIEIARQDRPSLYDHWVDRPEPLVDRDHRIEVRGRLGSDGTELETLSLDDLGELPEDTEAVAVCLLHSDLNPAHELAVTAELEGRGFDVSPSCEVSPQFREYERTATTVANAYLRPLCQTYLGGLDGVAGEVTVMTSAGGLVSLGDGARLPASLLLSGPAGGVRAAAAAAVASGWPDAVTFDMGGTSTDVCLVLDGEPAPAGERSVAGLAIRLPSLDVHTVGAGGGSIASLDRGGSLVVGPLSAGAVPGPACYGQGGSAPTVTDADLVAGRYPEGAVLPGIGELDVAAARRALNEAGVTAADVIAVVDANMQEAVRAVTVARGVDPAGLALVAFGGAGPLHAVAVARALDMAAVIVPARAGVLSAVGCLTAPRQHDLVRTWPGGSDVTGLVEALDALAREAGALIEGSEVETALDCRFEGQSHEIRVGSIEEFPAAHQLHNGYTRADTPIEVVAIRATARVASPVGGDTLPAGRRTSVEGPAVIAEADCTIWVPDGWRADPHPTSGALILTRTSGRTR